ncbi:MAG TPA: carbohydrate ABC transporter permease [Thermotogaceae bacterium]|nr:carbohydrate ABC transporter permease [Thermotogota bacterium]HEW92675.1 carbohydrate ABC transporter permease [Thermotogaceae bacterium]
MVVKVKVKLLTKKFLTVTILVLLALIFAFPFYWMVVTSLQPLKDFMRFPPVLFPKHFVPENYIKAVKYIPFFKYFMNSVRISIMVTIGATVTSSFVAYGFSKIKWPGRDILFMITLATLMIPFVVLMIPLYIEFKSFGWLGSFKPLWIPAWFGSAWSIFFLRQFYLTIPSELTDSAKVDGASHLHIWFRIILPLAKPALSVVALFNFIWTWQDFLRPLIFLNDENMYTITLGLASFQQRHGGVEWNLMMAAATLATIPILILFIFMNKYLIEGIHITSGLKG